MIKDKLYLRLSFEQPNIATTTIMKAHKAFSASSVVKCKTRVGESTNISTYIYSFWLHFIFFYPMQYTEESSIKTDKFYIFKLRNSSRISLVNVNISALLSLRTYSMINQYTEWGKSDGTVKYPGNFRF